jgi:hypothetical protein
MATAALNIHTNRLAGLLGIQRIAKSDRLARLAANRRVVNTVYWTAVMVGALAVGGLALMHGMHLLKSAGVMPSTGAISGLETLVTSVMNSVKWFAATLVGLSACVIAAMFVGGHQSAHSHGMRVGFGIIALVCIPGLLA